MGEEDKQEIDAEEEGFDHRAKNQHQQHFAGQGDKGDLVWAGQETLVVFLFDKVTVCEEDSKAEADGKQEGDDDDQRLAQDIERVSHAVEGDAVAED